jgi:hypothetical protein
MMMRKLLVLGMLMLTGTGCGLWGSGVAGHVQRTVGAFTEVRIQTGIEASVIIGPQEPLQLQGDDNLLPVIQTEVQDNVLIATTTPGTTIYPRLPLTLRITTPVLTSVTATSGSYIGGDHLQPIRMNITATGGSRVTLTDLTTEDVTINAEGGSSVKLIGQGKRMDIVLSGASPLSSSSFPVETATLNASGASKGEVRVTSSISGTLSGSSTLTVFGNPTTRNITLLDSSNVTFP